MLRTILFVHSASPQGGQQVSTGLITQLEAALGPDCNIIKPAMTEPDNPAYEPWRARIEHELARISGEVVLIGPLARRRRFA